METVQELVEKVVLKRMKKGRPFTSKDITRKVRKKAPYIYVANSEVAEILRANVLTWSYAGTFEYCINLIFVNDDNGNQLKTYLYHPMHFSHLDYGKEDSMNESFL